jgi:glyoxylase-like metal-dependent hydrolase (beta-lactamase superfamily II)
MTPARRPSALRHIARCTTILSLLALPARAQDPEPATQATETVNFVKTGLFMVSGGGANTAVRLTGNGMILVDGKLHGHYASLVARAHAIADALPVRLLVLTGPDEKRTGTNSEFLQAGIPVIAQEHTKEILANGEDHIALPSGTFDEERTIKLGGTSLQLLHLSAVCTDVDTVVYFPDLKVVAVGDLYTSAMPEADHCGGRNLQSWGTVLRKVLKLDFDTVVPGTGPVVKRAELEAFADHIDKLAANPLPTRHSPNHW